MIHEMPELLLIAPDASPLVIPIRRSKFSPPAAPLKKGHAVPGNSASNRLPIYKAV